MSVTGQGAVHSGAIPEHSVPGAVLDARDIHMQGRHPRAEGSAVSQGRCGHTGASADHMEGTASLLAAEHSRGALLGKHGSPWHLC